MNFSNYFCNKFFAKIALHFLPMDSNTRSGSALCCCWLVSTTHCDANKFRTSLTVLSGNIAEEVPTVEVAEAMVDNVPMLSGHVYVLLTLSRIFFIELRRDFFITITTSSAAAPLLLLGKKGASKLATLPTLIENQIWLKISTNRMYIRYTNVYAALSIRVKALVAMWFGRKKCQF